jgi:hypothetical protein
MCVLKSSAEGIRRKHDAQIRDQKEVDHHMPTNLLKLIASYPNNLQANTNVPSPVAQVHQAVRITRLVRFQSQDLIQAAPTWEVPQSSNWASIFASEALVKLHGAPPVAFSAQYRELLDLNKSAAPTDEEDADHQRYRNPAEKQWHVFQHEGFAETGSDWLKFDLRASERTMRQRRPDTMDWSALLDLQYVW